jgi:signal transduction histidine kinase
MMDYQKSEMHQEPVPAPYDQKPASPRRDAWMRWVKVWHIVFYLTLVVPTILVLSSGTMYYSTELVLGLSLFMGLWYGLIMIVLLPKTQGKRQTVLSIIYLVVAFAAWFPLSRASWAYYLTASSFYGLMWGTLPFGLAVVGNIILTGLIIWSQALNIGKPITFSIELLLTGLMAVGWSALLALWMRSVIRESTERKRLIEQLEAAQQDLAAMERQAGVLQERQRMAQEIHDTLAQGFTSIVMQLEAADQVLPEGQEAVRKRLLQARETARLSLREARRLVQALSPEPLEGATLPEALRRVAQRWQEESNLPIDYSITGNPYALQPEVEVILLRFTQEGLANIRKHAQANRVTVTLSYMEDQVALDVHDDGQGFDPIILSHPPGSNRGGFGLHTMRERLAQLGGQLIVESSPGEGTTLAAQIPMEVKA